MSYERLIAEHDRIDAKVAELSALVGAETPDVAAVVIVLSDLSGAVSEHLAHEDSLIYPRMISASHTELSEVALGFVDQFAALTADWGLYLREWGSEQIAGDWQGFRGETRAIMARLAARIGAENELLYPAAFRNGLIPLRGRG